MEKINYERALIESLVTQREAMIAENKSLELRGECPVYLEANFNAIVNRLEEMARMM